jgi:hypothetical protein
LHRPGLVVRFQPDRFSRVRTMAIAGTSAPATSSRGVRPTSIPTASPKDRALPIASISSLLDCICRFASSIAERVVAVTSGIRVAATSLTFAAASRTVSAASVTAPPIAAERVASLSAPAPPLALLAEALRRAAVRFGLVLALRGHPWAPSPC